MAINICNNTPSENNSAPSCSPDFRNFNLFEYFDAAKRNKYIRNDIEDGKVKIKNVNTGKEITLRMDMFCNREYLLNYCIS